MLWLRPALLASALSLGCVANAGEAGVGAIIHARNDEGQSLDFRVDSITEDPTDLEHEVHLYGVSERGPDGEWRPHCQPDAQGVRAAIPLAGSWDSQSGRYQPGSEGQLTLACTSGAIGKCVRFGYKPWATHNGVSLSAYHAACMRMIRADYCGDGRPHTRDGTQIDVYDRLGVQVEAATPGVAEDFEAAWSPEGATYVHIPRWSDDLAALVAECPERLAGRTALDLDLDAAGAARAWPETLVFNNRIHDPLLRRPGAAGSTPSPPIR